LKNNNSSFSGRGPIKIFTFTCNFVLFFLKRAPKIVYASGPTKSVSAPVLRNMKDTLISSVDNTQSSLILKKAAHTVTTVLDGGKIFEKQAKLKMVPKIKC
jgi:hypothetical protein